MMKGVLISFRVLVTFTVLTGLIYPGIITLISFTFFSKEAGGSLVLEEEKVIGSKLIGQNFTQEIYFWPRPSSSNYETLPSGASNLGWTSALLQSQFMLREKKWSSFGDNIPLDLLFASGSGLDPHISIEAAEFQIQRVAKARGIEIEELQKLILQHTELRFFGVLGQRKVNVMLLNRALDKLSKGKQL